MCLSGHFVTRGAIWRSHVTVFPLAGNKLERGGPNEAHVTLFPPRPRPI
jgi:hypothetical protein